MDILIAIIGIFFGILQVILFFKIWGMTNDVRTLTQHLLNSTNPQNCNAINELANDVNNLTKYVLNNSANMQVKSNLEVKKQQENRLAVEKAEKEKKEESARQLAEQKRKEQEQKKMEEKMKNEVLNVINNHFEANKSKIQSLTPTEIKTASYDGKLPYDGLSHYDAMRYLIAIGEVASAGKYYTDKFHLTEKDAIDYLSRI